MMYGVLWQIEPQLNEKGYTMGEQRELAEKLHFSLNVCHIHQILTDGEYNKALDRLNKFVVKNAVPLHEPPKEVRDA